MVTKITEPQYPVEYQMLCVKKWWEAEVFEEIMVTNFFKFDMKTTNPQIQ